MDPHHGCSCCSHGVVIEDVTDEITEFVNFSQLQISTEEMAELLANRKSKFGAFSTQDSPLGFGTSGRTVRIVPFAPPSMEQPDIEPFEVPVSGIDTIRMLMPYIERQSRIPEKHWVLFSGDGKYEYANPGLFVKYFDMLEGDTKTLYLVVNRKENVEYMFEQHKAYKTAQVQSSNEARMQRAWRQETKPEGVSEADWTRYMSGREEFENLTEDMSKFEVAESAHRQKYIENVRARVWKNFTQISNLPESMRGEEMRSRLCEGILPFFTENDYFYSVRAITRVYSPFVPGTFLDLVVYFYERPRYSYIEYYSSLAAVSGTITGPQDAEKARSLQKQGVLDSKDTIFFFEMDDRKKNENRTMAPQYRIYRLKKAFLGSEHQNLMSERHFAMFLLHASGLTTVELEDSPVRIGNVRRMIKRSYTPSPESDNEEDSELISNGSNESDEEEEDNSDDEGVDFGNIMRNAMLSRMTIPEDDAQEDDGDEDYEDIDEDEEDEEGVPFGMGGPGGMNENMILQGLMQAMMGGGPGPQPRQGGGAPQPGPECRQM